MPNRLSESDVRRYHEDGYVAPITVLSPDHAAYYRRRLEEAEALHGEAMQKILKIKSHLVLTFFDELVHHPTIVDAVEDVLGPNILAWTSNVFAKKPRDPSYVSWHQDLTYWGLEPPNVVSAWVALTASTPANGCMRVIPSTHKLDVVPHRDTFAEHNLLSRGQEIAVEVDETRAVDLVLKPGQMSLHHVKLFHGSNPNRSDHSRIGFSIRYVSADVRQVVGAKDSAMLVRGIDTAHNFEYEPRPKADFDPDALTLHAAVCDRQAKVFFKGTEPPDSWRD